MTKRNAANAGQADHLMQEASRVVGNANETMNKLTGSMQEISKSGEETSKEAIGDVPRIYGLHELII